MTHSNITNISRAGSSPDDRRGEGRSRHGIAPARPALTPPPTRPFTDVRRFNLGVARYTEIMYSSRVQYSSYSADPDRPSADEMAAVHRRMNPPVNELPVPLPVNLVVARAENVVVALSGVNVYSAGFAFTLRIQLRTRPERIGRTRCTC